MDVQARPIGQWFKSSKSGPNCDNCLEVQFLGGGNVELRNSRAGPDPGLRRRRVGRLHRRREGGRVRPARPRPLTRRPAPTPWLASARPPPVAAVRAAVAGGPRRGKCGS